MLDAVNLFLDHIQSNIDSSHCTGSLYMDLRKAFDTVHHGNLVSKLPHYGIMNLELAWLENTFLTGLSMFAMMVLGHKPSTLRIESSRDQYLVHFCVSSSMIYTLL